MLPVPFQRRERRGIVGMLNRPVRDRALDVPAIAPTGDRAAGVDRSDPTRAATHRTLHPEVPEVEDGGDQ